MSETINLCQQQEREAAYANATKAIQECYSSAWACASDVIYPSNQKEQDNA